MSDDYMVCNVNVPQMFFSGETGHKLKRDPLISVTQFDYFLDKQTADEVVNDAIITGVAND